MGIKLARRLEELHLSRVKFASMLGVSQQRVCQIIGGGAKKLEMWERIADTLDTPLSYFMDEEAESGMITITGDPAGIRQALTNLQGKEKDPLGIIEAGPEKGIIELLNDDDLCRRFAISQEERASLLTIRGGLVKTKEQAIIILTALKS